MEYLWGSYLLEHLISVFYWHLFNKIVFSLTSIIFVYPFVSFILSPCLPLPCLSLLIWFASTMSKEHERIFKEIYSFLTLMQTVLTSATLQNVYWLPSTCTGMHCYSESSSLIYDNYVGRQRSSKFNNKYFLKKAQSPLVDDLWISKAGVCGSLMNFLIHSLWVFSTKLVFSAAVAESRSSNRAGIIRHRYSKNNVWSATACTGTSDGGVPSCSEESAMPCVFLL